MICNMESELKLGITDKRSTKVNSTREESMEEEDLNGMMEVTTRVISRTDNLKASENTTLQTLRRLIRVNSDVQIWKGEE